MRDVSAKSTSMRTATARSTVVMNASTVAMWRVGELPKGDPLPFARVAATMAVKNTPQIIPLCHTVPIDHIDVRFEVTDDRMETTVFVKGIYRTGVEMEAMTGASAAALTIYDMLKIVDDDLFIEGIRLLEKTGGKSNVRIEGRFTAAVIVVSDSVANGRAQDRSGARLRERLIAMGGEVGAVVVVPDEIDQIRAAVEAFGPVDFVFTTGGNGLSPRDVTPEAVEPLLDRRLPGVEAHLHGYGAARLPFAMLSRLIVGQRGSSIVVTLPGSTSACDDAIDALFPYLLHAIPMLRGEGH